MKKCFVVLLAVLGMAAPLAADSIIPLGDSWRYFKGTQEASNPTNAWRALEFDASGWLAGAAPFHYGTNAAGGDDEELGGTILGDMRGNYTGLYLRHEFAIRTNALTELRLGFYTDDGLIAWINGTEVRVAGVSRSRLGYTDGALGGREAAYFEYVIPATMLWNGTNVLAVQALNYRIDDDDFRVDAMLAGTFADIAAPAIAGVSPAPGLTVTNLTEVSVAFDEPVLGVTAEDLRLNGLASVGVSGSGQFYVFQFPQPGAGLAQLDWDVGHGIADLEGNAFDETEPGASWGYTVVDGIAPQLVGILPERDRAVAALGEIEVTFSEPVAGVDAADLRVNGVPATGVVPVGAAGYRFSFTAAAPGEVVVDWDPAHGITDQAVTPNPFEAAGWSYVVLPGSRPNEFAAVALNSTWRFFKGTSEASSPTNAWREPGFDDGGWTAGLAPFHYGTNAVGGDDDLTGGTILGDMRGQYTSLFLRQAFVLETNGLLSLTLRVHFDDAFAVWINGGLAQMVRVSPGRLAHTATAVFPLPEATVSVASVPMELMQSGTNLMTIQAFNYRITDEDFRVDAELVAETRDLGGPVIVGAIPPRESAVSGLSAVTVVFDEPVTGVEAADLRINGDPAAAVVGGPGNSQFTFVFTAPAPGRVAIDWDDTHGITDLAGNSFDPLAMGARWGYAVADLAAPTVVGTGPVAGARVTGLTEAEVVFSEPVTGVRAGDLLVNGVAASAVTGAGAGPYRFGFGAPAAGPVVFTWAGDQAIEDAAQPPNRFGGGSWSVTFAPGAVMDVVLHEILAANVATNSPYDLDEDGELQDWIELWNRGNEPVNLLGWSLTDDPAQPRLWTFPAVVLGPGEYLLVYASGKDRRTALAGTGLHSNFRLNQRGEYLALFSADEPRVARSVFEPEYPEQRNDFSYGRDASDAWRYYALPTPLAGNGSSAITEVAPKPHVSVRRGLFDRPFELVVSSPEPGATLRYTLDGSEPTAGTGTLYTGPIPVSRTTVFRVAAFAPNQLPSLTETHTYIFPEQVLRQPSAPAGFPSTWGTWSSGGFPNNLVPADYEMDPEIVDHPAYRDEMAPALMALPVLSIVMKTDDMFGAAQGIYSHVSASQTQYRGPAWERACSAELILTNGETGFQIDCGIQMQGNASRDPHKQPKHPLRLLFKGAFGPGKLEYQLFPGSIVRQYDTVVLRSDFNDAWTHWDPNQRLRGQRVRDAWAKDTMRDMGSLAGHSRYVHLYINGLYWGVYDPSERIDADFGASYLGGVETEYDAMVSKPTQAIDGDRTAYDAMVGLSGLDNPARYEEMLGYLDLVQFIDYMMLNFYGANQDWGVDGNWNAIRRRSPEGRFMYVPWDCERMLEAVNANRVSNTDVPSGLHTKLVANPEYRLAFADRAHKHLFNGGALTPEATSARYARRIGEVELALLAESARWGDYRRDVHSYQNGPYYLYTRDEHWQTERNRLMNEYFPQRTGVFLQQLRSANLYPAVAAPVFNQHGGRIPRGFELTLSAPAGTIYYTTDGSDPRVFGSGAVAGTAQAHDTPLTLGRTVEIKARVLSGATWSALNAATFVVEDLLPAVRITELMYNPLPGGSAGEAYEFLEIQNVGGIAVDLGGYTLDGVSFEFKAGTILSAGARLVLGSGANPNAWVLRYPGVTPHGWYQNRLSNSGEQVALLDAQGRKVVSVDYGTSRPWPTAADGGGASLEIIDPNGDPDDPANWRASAAINGTPGLPPAPVTPPDIVLNELIADARAVEDGAELPDWIELHNRGAGSMDLAGWSLTDSGDPRKYVFPAGTILEAGGYLVVWCAAETDAPGLHTGFALGRGGETVELYDAAGLRVDAVSFGLQAVNHGLGRVEGEWRLTEPTPGAVNVAAVLAPAGPLLINEWLADAPPGGSDWIELYNPSATAPAALRGIFLGTSNALFQYKAHAFIAPGGFVQLLADEAPGPDHLDFKLAKEGGAIVLHDATAAEVHRVIYGPQRQSVSEGLLPNGSATVLAFPGSASPAASNYVVVYTGPRLNELLAWNRSAERSPWGTFSDWIELLNPDPEPFELSGMALSDSSSGDGAWVFPAGVSIPGSGHLRVWCDGAEPGSTGAGEDLNTGFGLNRESGGVYLFNALGQVMEQVEYGFQVVDQSIGRAGESWSLLASPTPGAVNAAPASLGPVTTLRLNEWMANPESGSDWFELYNPDAAPVALSGLFLTDNPSVYGVTNFAVAPLSYMGGRSWVVWQADNSPRRGFNHVNFALDAMGETLRLYSAAGDLIDSINFGIQMPGVSVGRLPDGGGSLMAFPASASPERANYLPLTNVVINELLTHAADPLEPAIELHNPGTSPAAVGGWYLSDSETDLQRFAIPAGTSIAPGGYAVFYAYQFSPAGLQLDPVRGGRLFLSGAHANGQLTGYRTTVEFGPALPGVSFGRHVTSLGEDFVALSRRTFGADTPESLADFRSGTGGVNALPRVGPVVISEIMFQPVTVVGGAPTELPEAEFLEIQNISAEPVDLYDPLHPTHRWKLANAVSFAFPAGSRLAPGESALVVRFDPVANPATLSAFRGWYSVGTGVKVLGPWTGRLSNQGESIELYQPGAPLVEDPEWTPDILVERIAYLPGAPWPSGADGTGHSLQRIDRGQYANDPVNWQAAPPTADPFGELDSDGDGMPDSYETAYGLKPAVADADGDLDGDGMSNGEEYRAGTRPDDAGSLLRAQITFNGSTVLSFEGMEDRAYRIEYREAVGEGEWEVLTTLPPLGASGAREVTDPAPANSRFYRLIVVVE